MLNELYRLSRTLEHQNLLPQDSTHRDVHKLAKCECLYLQLDAEGKPAAMRLLNKDETGGLWLHSKGNHDRFPVARIQKPLLAESISSAFNAERWKKAELEERRQLLHGLDYTAANADSREVQVKPWTLEQMEPVLRSTDPVLEALRLLLGRFPGKENSGFYRAFREFIKGRSCDLNKEEAEFAKKLLVGTYDAKKQKYTTDCRIYFDILELSKVDYPVASPEVEEALIRCLINAQEEPGGEIEPGGTAESALSGTCVPLITDKYPNPKFQIIGPAYLFSNNTSAIPCLSRYHMEGTQTFPAGRDQAQRMSDALGFLMQDSCKGKTWTSFPGNTDKKPMLLLAWLEDDPECDIRLAAATGEDGATEIYEKICSSVLGFLSRKMAENPSAPVHLQLFETLDPGRKQLAFDRALSVSQLHNDIDEWLEASHNLPDIYFHVNFKNKEGKVTPIYRPHCPGPGAVRKLLHMEYHSQHNSNPGRLQDSKAGGVTVQDIYRLYLPEVLKNTDDIGFTRMFLKELLRVSSELLTDAGHFQSVLLAEQPFSEDGMRSVCTAVSLMGILLYKLGIRKEQFMKSKMFMAGQMLKLADRLHKNYCIIVRNNETVKEATKSLPGQLMGNALFQMALENPSEALARLAEKITLYTGWADTNLESESKWILSAMGKIAAEIGENGEPLPQQPSADDKVQLLLGYLATVFYGSNENSGENEKTNKEGQ